MLLNLKKIVKIGNLYGYTGGSFPGMIYSTIGICPTINCMGGVIESL